MERSDLLKETVKHIDITSFDAVPLVEAYGDMAFQSRNLASASRIYDRMLADPDCTIILTLAGSLISAGLKKVFTDMIDNNMVDVIVSSGANIVDMDFFEALGFRHYLGTPHIDDDMLRELHVDRIFDTFIDEGQLCECDQTIHALADSLGQGVYSSREFIWEMGKYLEENGCKAEESVILSAYRKGVPIFVPAFSDCSAGFALADHQRNSPGEHVIIDSIRDFRELIDISISTKETGILMLGGGVPKNFVQDSVLGGECDDNGRLLEASRMHKYAIQITIADERDGALSGSTLKEACSWGKVDTANEQMVFSEVTLALPLLASYAYHKGSWKRRPAMDYIKFLKVGST